MTVNHTSDYILRVRITALPDPAEFDEFEVAHFRVGQIYELPVRLATLLIISGYAESAGASLPAEAADVGAPRFLRPRPFQKR